MFLYNVHFDIPYLETKWGLLLNKTDDYREYWQKVCRLMN